MSKKYSIYALIKDEVVFYVGITSDVSKRIYNHSYFYDFPISHVILEVCECPLKQALIKEKEWIEKYVDRGIALENFKHNKKAIKRIKERNGKCYLGAWIDERVVDKAKVEAKKDKRTLSSYVEMALSNHNDFAKST